MRIRSVKPEWLEDERLIAAGSEARMFSVALMLLADDHGRGRASEIILAGRVYPGDPDALAKVRESLARLSGWFVKLYEVRGQRYFHVCNWAKHQKVDHPGKPLCPGPEEAETPQVSASSRDSRETLAPETDQETETETDQETDGRAPLRVAARPSPAAPGSYPRAIQIWCEASNGLVDFAKIRLSEKNHHAAALHVLKATGGDEAEITRLAANFWADPWHRDNVVGFPYFASNLSKWEAPPKPKKTKHAPAPNADDYTDEEWGVTSA
jgi:hypothetical protein